MNTCLGVFDSGVGGLTVLQRLFERHGDLPCIYLADNARIPFGDKDVSEIRFIATQIAYWLNEQDISIILMACNTTNSLALDVIQQVAGVEVLSLISSAAQMINESRVGILATPATVSSSAYSSAIKLIKSDTFVIEQGCPAFVPLIESGYLTGQEIESAAKEYLAPLLEARVETIVLGCSHYPFLEPLLRQLLPKNVRLVDPAIGLATKLDKFLTKGKMEDNIPITFANTRFCVTSSPKAFAKRVQKLIGKCPEVELVSLRSKACFF